MAVMQMGQFVDHDLIATPQEQGKYAYGPCLFLMSSSIEMFRSTSAMNEADRKVAKLRERFRLMMDRLP